jgi:hypothetical protein
MPSFAGLVSGKLKQFNNAATALADTIEQSTTVNKAVQATVAGAKSAVQAAGFNEPPAPLAAPAGPETPQKAVVAPSTAARKKAVLLVAVLAAALVVPFLLRGKS